MRDWEQLSREKSQYKQLWRMNCHQLNVHESELYDKDVKITRLQNCLAESRVVVPGSETGRSERGPPPVPVTQPPAVTPQAPVTPPPAVTPQAPVTPHVLITPHTPVHIPVKTGKGVVSGRRFVPHTTRVEK